MQSLAPPNFADVARHLRSAVFIFAICLAAQPLLLTQAIAATENAIDLADFSPVLVRLSINRQVADATVMVWRSKDDRWLIPSDSLTNARVRIAADVSELTEDGIRYIPLSALSGATLDFDEATLSLEISIAPSAFEPTTLKTWNAPMLGQASGAAGLFLNYDLMLSGGDGQFSQSLFTEWGAAIGKGVGLTNIALLRDEAQSRLVRLDTNYTLDKPERLATWRFGDAVSRPATTLGRPVRFGGLQYTTNFQIQPGLLTAPVPTLNGQAALPSMVDLYVNNVLQSRTSIPPGPFSITTAPIVSGDGEVIVRVRDISGREELISGRFYSSPLLLAPGLSDFSVEAGSLRKNFAQPGDDYSGVFGSASYRRGITERLTLEGGAQAASGGPVGLLGGAAAAIPGWGTASFAAGVSGSDVGTGTQFAAGWDRRTASTSLGLRTERADSRFRQIGIDPSFRISARDMAFWSYRFNDIGSLGLSYTRQQTVGRDMAEVFGISFSTQRTSWGQFTISALKSKAEEKEYSLNLFWILPIERDWNASLSHSANTDAPSSTVFQAQKSAPYGAGLGWRLQTAINAAQQAAVYAQHNYGMVRAEAGSFQGRDSARLSLSGAVARIDGQWFPTRRISGSYGLVNLPGLSNVRVYVDNQLMGRTDDSGYALLPRLHPYVANHVSIEPMDLPMDTKIDSLLVRPVPGWRSGVIVNFPVRKITAATLRIVDQLGRALPAGAVVTIAGVPESFAIGRDGLAYLEGLSGENLLKVSWPGRSCEVLVNYAPSDELVPYLGEFECREAGK